MPPHLQGGSKMPDPRFQSFARRHAPPTNKGGWASYDAFLDGCPGQQEQGFGAISRVIGDHLCDMGTREQIA